MGISKGMDVKSIWNYVTRTLTQSQFPFWSSVIDQQYGNYGVNANSFLYVTIQPPSGETWLIYIDFYLATTKTNCNVKYWEYNGSTARRHNKCTIGGSYGILTPHLSVSKILTSSRYARLEFFNADSTIHSGYMGYSGFKLGTKIVEFEDIKTVETKPIERATKYKIKSEFEELKDMIRDVYFDEIDDYKQVVYFYKDKPIRKDKRTGHVIERAGSYIETDVLLKNLEKIRNGELDLKKTGYKEWLEKIKKERGIDLLRRL